MRCSASRSLGFGQGAHEVGLVETSLRQIDKLDSTNSTQAVPSNLRLKILSLIAGRASDAGAEV